MPSAVRPGREVLAGILVLVALAWFLLDRPGAPTGGRATTTPSSSRVAYAPRSAAPRDAIPGGSLDLHEGIEGGHAVRRHVGRSPDDLRRRLEDERIREASTFEDLAAADRAVAATLYERRGEVAAWLASSPRGGTTFTARLAEPAGLVLRSGDAAPRPCRTVVLVLHASDRFPEGFRIHTAYARLP
jgi:hypothetical protein